MAEERDGPAELEPGDRGPELGVERPVAGELERHVRELRACPCERLEQDAVTLDLDQPADERETRHTGGSGRRRPRVEPVVHDLEPLLLEALALGQVAGEPCGDGDVDVREPRYGAVCGGERPAAAERVEPVLRRDEQRDAREAAGGEPVEVRVDEMRVEHVRPQAADRAEEPAEDERVDGGAHPEALDRDADHLEPVGELGCARLALVQHQQADVVPARSERGEEEQEVVLGPGDARDLRDVDDSERALHPASSTTRSAHTSTECSRTTVPWSVRPSAWRSASSTKRIASARLSGSPCSKRSGSGRSVSNE